MKPFKRVIVIVMDSLGIGALPDAKEYGDGDVHTFKHAAEAKSDFSIPNLSSLGLAEVGGFKNSVIPSASIYARMREVSKGKDTTTGHWEMMGLKTEVALSQFLEGFPEDLLSEFKRITGCKGVLGNKAASGTEIIDELGAEHLKTGFPIVYTSADSVFQIAWHEKAFGLDKLYKICEQTRELLDRSSYKVGRVIARPFITEENGKFKRTENRKDYSITPFGPTALDKLTENGVNVFGIGKIPSIYDYQGISEVIKATNDRDGFKATLETLKNKKEGLIFTNLNDLDMLYGHRRDALGYAKQIELIDQHLPSVINALSSDDLLIMTADHGNDPTYKGSDHTREHVPLLIHSPRLKIDRALDDRSTFADLGETILENFGIKAMGSGQSLLKEILK